MQDGCKLFEKGVKRHCRVTKLAEQPGEVCGVVGAVGAGCDTERGKAELG